MKALSMTVAAFAAVLGAAVGWPSPENHVRHETRDDVLDHSWVKRGKIDESVSIPVRMGLTQSNLEAGAEMLFDISHPASPNFGAHLSQQEVINLFAPAQDRIDVVRSWLQSSMAQRPITLAPSRLWLQLNASIAELQDLLHTTYYEYEHTQTGKTVLGCEEYYVPAHVRAHLDFITPGVKTLELRKRPSVAKRDYRPGGGPVQPKLTKFRSFSAQTPASTSDCDFVITPSCVRALYNISDTLTINAANSIGIYENEDQFWNQTDLDDFFKTFTPHIPQGTHPVYDAIDGAPSPGPEYYLGPEADLDFQAVYPLVYPDKVVNFQTDDTYYETVGANDITGLFNTFLDALDKTYCTYSAYGVTGDTPGIDPVYPDKNPGGYDHPEQCGVYRPTNVLSVSWGIDEDALPMNYQLRQCNEWMKLGLQGVSVIFATGDTGVAPRDDVCARNNTLFATQSPVDCPYVTAVGSTYLPPGGMAGKTSESAATAFGSGGGFSNIFGQPAYQAHAVKSYFANHSPPYPHYNITHNATHTSGIYNRGGRGYPDVSAVGQNFAIFWQGDSYLADGTSVSTPVFAGMIARINSARLHADKKPLGFLNPTLYAHPELFNDITSGNNPGCGTDGFSAVEGWDPVTGLGTPRYHQMKELFLSLE